MVQGTQRETMGAPSHAVSHAVSYRKRMEWPKRKDNLREELDWFREKKKSR